jgi:hypothetical protein
VLKPARRDIAVLVLHRDHHVEAALFVLDALHSMHV